MQKLNLYQKRKKSKEKEREGGKEGKGGEGKGGEGKGLDFEAAFPGFKSWLCPSSVTLDK